MSVLVYLMRPEAALEWFFVERTTVLVYQLKKINHRYEKPHFFSYLTLEGLANI
jgi:hypothetical protein